MSGTLDRLGVVFILLEKFAFYLLQCKLIQQQEKMNYQAKMLTKLATGCLVVPGRRQAVFDHHESMQIQVVGLKASLAILLSPTIKYVDKDQYVKILGSIREVF